MMTLDVILTSCTIDGCEVKSTGLASDTSVLTLERLDGLVADATVALASQVHPFK